MKKIMYSVIGTILLAGGLYGAWKMTSKPTEIKQINFTFSKNDRIKGNKDSKVILIEYSDFQCPACKAYFPLVKQIADTFKDKAAIIYRHFPLPQHQNAQKAAYSAESAGNQGKFWEMHDLLFKNQENWSDKSNIDELLLSYAKELKLDEEQFKKDIASKKIHDKVDTDVSSGQEAGVNSTPSFFLNGEKLDNPSNFETFKKIIEKAVDSQSINKKNM